MSDYLTRAQLKATLQITGTASDADVDLAISAASRAVEEYKRLNGGRSVRFYPTVETRYYSPKWDAVTLDIDDIAGVVSVKVDRTRNFTYSETWTAGTHFVMEPANNPLEGKPQRTLVRLPLANSFFPQNPQSVSVTGTFGWASTPYLVTEAATILAARLYQRRNAPFGILAVGIDSGTAARLPRTDPDVVQLLDAVDSNVPRVFA
jgi:hypothetical protein